MFDHLLRVWVDIIISFKFIKDCTMSSFEGAFIGNSVDKPFYKHN